MGSSVPGGFFPEQAQFKKNREKQMKSKEVVGPQKALSLRGEDCGSAWEHLSPPAGLGEPHAAGHMLIILGVQMES